jgi:hypothetical protein
MQKPSHFLRVAASSALLFAGANVLKADNTFFTPGDLILFLQEEDASGPAKTIYVSLGSAATGFRGAATGAADKANAIDIVDLGAALTAAFDTNWKDRTDIYAGLCAVWGNSATNGTLQDGDPHRTLYVSQPRTTVGTLGQPGSSVPSVNTNTGMTTGANGMLQMGLVFDDDTGTGGYNQAVLELPKSVSTIDDQNPFLTVGSTTIQDTAFGIFSGGVQQQGAIGAIGTLGPVGNVEFALDLYRIQARNNVTGQVGFGETLRSGTLEGTIVIDQTGKVSFLTSSGATSNFETWANNNALVGADRAGNADVEKDGIPNGVEFVIGGNPKLATDADKLPTLERNGGNLIFRFPRTDESVYLNPHVEFDSDLVGPWTKAVDGVGGVVITVDTDFFNTTTDRVNVSIPSAGDTNFARLVVPDPN